MDGLYVDNKVKKPKASLSTIIQPALWEWICYKQKIEKEYAPLLESVWQNFSFATQHQLERI